MDCHQQLGTDQSDSLKTDPIVTDMELVAVPVSALSIKRRKPPKEVRNLISDLLLEHNGKRKIRVLSQDRILRLLADTVQKGNWRHVHSGTVANKYGYPAYSTVALAFIFRGFLFLSVKRISAKQGCTGFGQLDLITKDETKERLIGQAFEDVDDTYILFRLT